MTCTHTRTVRTLVPQLSTAAEYRTGKLLVSDHELKGRKPNSIDQIMVFCEDKTFASKYRDQLQVDT